ncbi:MAG: RNA-binding cell elongation regulator Jag/EloR [Desulfatiglandales bacterium]|jgi:spoIIIJ-associated protein
METQTYEFEGKTTEEAIENAAAQLNVPPEDLNVDIIEPGSAGIFGLVGGRKAKIKVTFKSPPTTQEGDELLLAQQTLEKILSLIPVEATIQSERTNGKVTLTIVGDRSGLLIGRKGKTLDALQYVVTKIVNKALDKKIHLVIDSENYRKRRTDSITQLALRMGEKAKRIKKPVTTNPLNPHDRRLVHLALKEDEDLETRSRGEGLLKKVVILPKIK